jgi:anti-sigma regulatory factor (Ser/Thr protein kinase)
MLRLHRQLPATADSVAQLRTLTVAYALEHCQTGDQLLDDVALAVSEAATNAVQHAYPAQREPGVIELDAYPHTHAPGRPDRRSRRQ